MSRRGLQPPGSVLRPAFALAALMVGSASVGAAALLPASALAQSEPSWTGGTAPQPAPVEGPATPPPPGWTIPELPEDEVGPIPDPVGPVAIAISGDPNNSGESATLLTIDRQLSDAIFDQGPLIGYAAAMSDDGVLFDSNGGGAPGQVGVQNRFRTFPSELRLERRPLRAMASGPVGTTWGIFVVKRGDQVLTEGYYVTSWRLEADGWRIVAELAAGRAPAPPAALPNRPPPPGATGAAPGPLPASTGRPASATGTPAGSSTEAQPTGSQPTLPQGPVLRDALGRPVVPGSPVGRPASPPPPPASTPAPGQ